MMKPGIRPWAEKTATPFETLMAAVGEQTRRDYLSDLRVLLGKYRKERRCLPEGSAVKVIDSLIGEFKDSAPAKDMSEIEELLRVIGCTKKTVMRLREIALDTVLSWTENQEKKKCR